jgi:hypothetical protein
MEIIINNPREVVVVPEKKVMLSKITVLNVSDHPDSKIVTAFTSELGVIILWQNEEYDAIGQWTDTDVINRLNELYNS